MFQLFSEPLEVSHKTRNSLVVWGSSKAPFDFWFWILNILVPVPVGFHVSTSMKKTWCLYKHLNFHMLGIFKYPYSFILSIPIAFTCWAPDVWPCHHFWSKVRELLARFPECVLLGGIAARALGVDGFTLWYTNIALKHPPFEDVPIDTMFFFSSAMWVFQMVDVFFALVLDAFFLLMVWPGFKILTTCGTFSLKELTIMKTYIWNLIYISLFQWLWYEFGWSRS